MATQAEVEKTLHELIRKLDGASTNGRSLPEKRTLLVKIRDLDLSYTAIFGEGKISEMNRVEDPEEQDVNISVGSDDLISLAAGKMGVAGAMLTGKLRVDAGMRDLLLIRQLF